MLFDKYIPPSLETIRVRFKKITPVAEMAHIQMLCHLLNCFLIPANTPADCPKEWHELYFVFACIWAFGSAMFQDQAIDYRVEFSKWWVNEFKTVKFPPGECVPQILKPNRMSFTSPRTHPHLSQKVEQFSTTSWTARQRPSCPGRRRHRNSSWTRTCRCRLSSCTPPSRSACVTS